MATTYFSIASTDITNEIYPDTDCSATNIGTLAQRLEYEVMQRLGLSSAPTDAVDLATLKRAIILLTAADLESREPHSRADGSVREDKYSRFEWRQEAEAIIRRYERTFLRT